MNILLTILYFIWIVGPLWIVIAFLVLVMTIQFINRGT